MEGIFHFISILYHYMRNQNYLLYNTEIQKIPKIIHQTWKKYPKDMPAHFKMAVQSWIDRNPEYEHRFYDDHDCLEFIREHYPEYQLLYKNLKLPVQKADVFRYLILHRYGGFYTDVDTTCIRSLRELFTPGQQQTCILGKDRHRNGRIEILQWFLASVPNHPLWKITMRVIQERFRLFPSTPNNKKIDNYTLWLTGPRAFTEAVSRYEKLHEIPLTIKDPCFFGNYHVAKSKECLEKAFLIHHYEGSWKNNWRKHQKKWNVPLDVIQATSNSQYLALYSVMLATQQINDILKNDISS